MTSQWALSWHGSTVYSLQLKRHLKLRPIHIISFATAIFLLTMFCIGSGAVVANHTVWHKSRNRNLIMTYLSSMMTNTWISFSSFTRNESIDEHTCYSFYPDRQTAWGDEQIEQSNHRSASPVTRNATLIVHGKSHFQDGKAALRKRFFTQHCWVSFSSLHLKLVCVCTQNIVQDFVCYLKCTTSVIGHWMKKNAKIPYPQNIQVWTHFQIAQVTFETPIKVHVQQKIQCIPFFSFRQQNCTKRAAPEKDQNPSEPLRIFTAYIRRMTEGNIFRLFILAGVMGTPIRLTGGAPSLVRMGGYPLPRSGQGDTLVYPPLGLDGVPPPPTGANGLPATHQDWMGVPPVEIGCGYPAPLGDREREQLRANSRRRTFFFQIMCAHCPVCTDCGKISKISTILLKSQ